MAASGQALKSEDQINEVAPGISVGCHDVEKLIYEYSFDASNPEWLKKPFTFFGISSLQQQILTLVTYAGPLDRVKALIRQAHSKRPDIFSVVFNEGGMQGTLCDLPIIGLDQTYRSVAGTEIDEGMAETLMQLHAELSPDTFPKALERARLAAPLEDEKEKAVREAINLAAPNQVFDAIKQNDEKTASAIETFKEFVKNTKPCVMTNNRYHLNLIHLLYGASDVLARRGGELEDGWYGKLGDRFCFEVIGAAIDRAVAPRIKQILESGLLNNNKKAARDVDGGGLRFSGAGSSLVLGVNSFYDIFGRGGVTRADGLGGVRAISSLRRRPAASRVFQNLLRAITTASNIYATADPVLAAPLYDNVGIRRSPAAMAAAP